MLEGLESALGQLLLVLPQAQQGREQKCSPMGKPGDNHSPLAHNSSKQEKEKPERRL